MEEVKRYADFLRGHVLLPADTLNAAGMSFHVADLFVPELLAASVDRAAPEACLALLLEPFCAALSCAPHKANVQRFRCGGREGGKWGEGTGGGGEGGAGGGGKEGGGEGEGG